MRTPQLLLIFGAILVGCDQQTAAPTGPYDKIDVQIGKADSTANGNSGDTSGTPGSVDTSGAVPAYTSAQLLGPVTLTGGTVRELLFFIAPDKSLHIIASSDGANGQSTVGRRTDWDVQITSPDSLSPSWVSTLTEGGQTDLLSRYMDYSNPMLPLYASHMMVHCVTSSEEVRIATKPGAALTIQVVAHSGIDNKTVGWTPPLLPDDITVKAIKLGLKQASVTSTTFQVYMPGKTAD